MCVQPEEAQDTGESRQVAVDDPFEAGNPAAAPVFEALGREQANADKDVDRSDGRPVP